MTANPNALQGRSIIVTGGFGVLGSAVASAAADHGAKVGVMDVAPAVPPTLVESFKTRSITAQSGVDLTDSAATAKAILGLVGQEGRLDALINIAGGFKWETVESGEMATWDRLYAINTRTAVNASKAALPYLVKSPAGSIVNIGANGAQKAALGMGAYAASKAGVHRLTETLAEEFKGRVTVNAVLPSIIDTPVNRADMPDADFESWVKPASLAAIILFLVSDQARDITGALIPVTGRV